jgi:hypothetical protein
VTRQELDRLISVQLDIERALWLVREMVNIAAAEHAEEDRVNTSLDEQQGADLDKKRSV